MKVNSCAMVFDDIGCYHNLKPKQEGPVNTDLIEFSILPQALGVADEHTWTRRCQ
jgi:hypothetical protein